MSVRRTVFANLRESELSAFFVLLASGVKTTKRSVHGWRIRNWFDWSFAVSSFVVFILLEAAIIYSYFVFARVW